MRIFITFLTATTYLTPVTEVPTEPMIFPLSGLDASAVLREYQAPLLPYGAGHRGIDLPASLGSPVLAPLDGIVSFAGTVGLRQVVSITSDSDLIASMEPVCSDLPVGTPVAQGDPVGTVCSPDQNYTQHCSETCLHFGTRNSKGYFSPLAILGGLGESRLVPTEN